MDIGIPLQLKRRRLGVVAGELERALEEVQARSAECEESRLQAERARARAWEESERVGQERESLRRRSVQVIQIGAIIVIYTQY